MAACSLPVQSQCYLLNSSPVSTIDRYEICEQKLRAYLGNAADYTRLTITDDMCKARNSRGIRLVRNGYLNLQDDILHLTPKIS